MGAEQIPSSTVRFMNALSDWRKLEQTKKDLAVRWVTRLCSCLYKGQPELETEIRDLLLDMLGLVELEVLWCYTPTGVVNHIQTHQGCEFTLCHTPIIPSWLSGHNTGLRDCGKCTDVVRRSSSMALPTD
jgi:hypothetical protein